MEKYKAIVFDMDGTVLDTLDELTKSLNYVFARHGLPALTQDAIRPCLGFGYDGFIDKAAPDAPEPLRRTMTEEFIAYYSAHCQTTTFPYAGIPQVLGRLKAAGYHMAIVSNKGQGAVSELHDEYFKDYVDFSLGETPMYRKKPAPDMVWEALKRLAVPKTTPSTSATRKSTKKRPITPASTQPWSPGASATGTSWNPSSRHTSSTRGKNWENSSEYEVPWLVARRGRPKGRPALGLVASG